MLDGARYRVAQRGTARRQLGWPCGHAHFRGTSAGGHPMRERERSLSGSIALIAAIKPRGAG
eukprot:364625-Chlamydomonas_euryale.AAC.10